MTSATTEPPTLRSIPTTASYTTAHRRSYSCYNCTYSFHITPTPPTSSSSLSSFRCPRCHHRHLIPHHTISAPPPPSPPSPPHLPPTTLDSGTFIYQTSDDSDFDEDYDSDNSILSLTNPNPSLLPSTRALKSIVASLPVKNFLPNSTPSFKSCSICLEDFEINPDSCETVNELPCDHYFHRDCIVEWLQRSNSCPLCRYKLPADTYPEEKIASDSDLWDVEYDSVLVVDLNSIEETTLGGINEEVSLGSSTASSDHNRQVLGFIGGEISRLDLDAMRDEDDDTLMVDA